MTFAKVGANVPSKPARVPSQISLQFGPLLPAMIMMKLKLFTLFAGLTFCLAAVRLPAQTGGTTNTSPTTSRITTSRVISDSEVKENLSTDTVNTRPANSDRPVLSSEVKERIRAFEKAREAYLEKQRELERRFKGATDEQRERIREQIKDRRDAWLEQHKQFKEDMRERLRELKRELPSLRKALDESRPTTRPGLD
jgi:hypothetical protein